jgi:hypothetical protein
LANCLDMLMIKIQTAGRNLTDSSRKPLLQIVGGDSKFLSDESGFIAFIRINRELSAGKLEFTEKNCARPLKAHPLFNNQYSF